MGSHIFHYTIATLSTLFVLAFAFPQFASAACNAAPTVSSVAASSITVSAGTVNGNVSSAGGGTCTVTARGFATSTSATLAAGSTATSTLAGTTGAYSASFNSTSLTGNTTYYFRAYAINANSTGLASILSFITLPNAPTALLFGSIAATTMSVSWTAPSPGGASTYTLEQCTHGTTTCTQTTSIAGVSQSVNSLTGNTNYDFAVQGVNANGGAGAWTATSSQLTLPAAPGSPTYDTVTTSSMNVNWTGSATTFNLERCITTTTTCTLTTLIASSPQAVSGLAAGTSYDFAVQGVNATGNSTWSATTTQVTVAATVINPGVVRLNGSMRITSGLIKVQ